MVSSNEAHHQAMEPQEIMWLGFFSCTKFTASAGHKDKNLLSANILHTSSFVSHPAAILAAMNSMFLAMPLP
jgi:hypothetical protein